MHDQLTGRARQTVERERQYVGALRVSDQDRVRALPVAGVETQDAIEVGGEAFGGAGGPEVAQRIPADDRDAASGERGGDLLVETGPPAVAGKQDREAWVGAAVDRDLDQGKVRSGPAVAVARWPSPAPRAIDRRPGMAASIAPRPKARERPWARA